MKKRIWGELGLEFARAGIYGKREPQIIPVSGSQSEDGGPGRDRTCDRRHVKAQDSLYSEKEVDLEAFRDFLSINLRLSPATVHSSITRARAFMRRGEVSSSTIKTHLKDYLTRAPATYNAELKVLHRLAKFLQCEDLLKSYKFAPVDTIPQEAPSNDDVQNGFKAQVNEIGKAVYLFIASSGLRKGEVLELKKEDVDFQTRAVVPRHFTRTKRSGLTFISEEALTHLEKYLSLRTDDKPLLFPISDRQWKKIWNNASEGAGCRMTAKRLRLWHSVELGEKGVPDRYIDAFQGRAPRSTLAKHYTSHGIERLKVVYDKAGLSVLS